MKLSLTIMLISLLVMLGCDQKAPVDSAKNDGTDGESRTDVIAKELKPVFPAEIFLESRSPDKSAISLSLILEPTRKGGEDETEKSWTDFKLHGGSVCKVYPTFIEHRDGYDVWRVELDYVASKESDGTPWAAVSKEILFDGKAPAVITENEHHSIVMRPRTETNPEQDGAG